MLIVIIIVCLAFTLYILYVRKSCICMNGWKFDESRVYVLQSVTVRVHILYTQDLYPWMWRITSWQHNQLSLKSLREGVASTIMVGKQPIIIFIISNNNCALGWRPDPLPICLLIDFLNELLSQVMEKKPHCLCFNAVCIKTLFLMHLLCICTDYVWQILIWTA